MGKTGVENHPYAGVFSARSVTHKSGGARKTLLVKELTFVQLKMKPEFWRLKAGWLPITLAYLP